MPTATLKPVREAAPRVIDHPLLRGRQLADTERLVLETRRFVREKIRPRALEVDRLAEADPGYFDWDIASAGGKLGLLNLIIPRASGGDVDRFCLRSALVIEEIAAGCGGFATLFGAHALGISPLIVGGPAFWDGVMTDVAASASSGDPMIMACAITEPAAGTDVEHADHVRTARIVSHADRVRGGWKLSGVKHFISNGNVARWVTVIMPEDPKRPYETTFAFLVDSESPGFSVTKVEHKMGQRASPAAELRFDGVFVPDKHTIGRPGDGTPAVMGVLAASRPVVGGIGTGIARGAYERLVEWLQSDDPAAAGLLDQQQVQLALAEMWEDIHLSRQAYIDAATEFDIVSLGKLLASPMVQMAGRMPAVTRTNPLVSRQLNTKHSWQMLMRLMDRMVGDESLTHTLGLSSMAKAHAGDVAVRVTNQALEIAGLDCGPLRAELEKCLRDAKLTQIYEGTNQLNRLESYSALVAEHSLEVLADTVARDRRNKNGRNGAGR